MKKVAASCVALLASASSLFAGTVTFSPNPIVIDPFNGPSTAQLAVSVAATEFGTLQSVDLVIGSDDLDISNFVYDPGFISATAFRSTPTYDNLPQVYPFNAQLGGFLNEDAASILVGSFTIDAAGLAAGDYSVEVSSVLDDGRSGLGSPLGDVEGLLGSVRVQVVPEPATLALLCLGSVGLIRRRLF